MCQQLAKLELDQLQQLLVVDQVDLVEEDDQGRHADLAGQEDVLAGLGHRAVGRRDHQDRSVHLGGAGDHVLDVVGVPRTIDVGVVAGLALILDVGDGDGDRLVGVADGPALGDVRVRLRLGLPVCGEDGQQGGGQGRLAVVDVPDRAHVDVRLRPRKRFLGHRCSRRLLETEGRGGSIPPGATPEIKTHDQMGHRFGDLDQSARVSSRFPPQTFSARDGPKAAAGI